ncbi:hypothetical protein ACEPAH_7085 [Sanghuangporus vaninii]
MSNLVGEYAVAAYDLAVLRYVGFAAISLVAYETVITVDKEVQHFWRRSLSMVTIIYLLNRYFELGIALLYLYGMRIVKVAACCARLATVFLGSSYFVQCSIMLSMLIVYERKFEEFVLKAPWACGSVTPSWFSTYWIPTLLFEFMLLCMTLYKSIASGAFENRSGTYRRPSLYRVLVRDQVIFFVSILLSATNIALWQGLPEGKPNNEGLTLSVAIAFVLGCRILLNLRRMSKRNLHFLPLHWFGRQDVISLTCHYSSTATTTPPFRLTKANFIPLYIEDALYIRTARFDFWPVLGHLALTGLKYHL